MAATNMNMTTLRDDITSPPKRQEAMTKTPAGSSNAETSSISSIRSWSQYLSPLRLRGGCGIEGACNCCEDPGEASRRRNQPLPQSPHWRASNLGSTLPPDGRSRTSMSIYGNELQRAETNRTNRSINIGVKQALARGGDEPAGGSSLPESRDENEGMTARPGTPQ